MKILQKLQFVNVIGPSAKKKLRICCFQNTVVIR